MSFFSCASSALRRMGASRVFVQGGPTCTRARSSIHQFLNRIVETNTQRSESRRILRADQMRERHRRFLGRREAMFAVKNHAVTAIQHQHRNTRTTMFRLVYVQVAILGD